MWSHYSGERGFCISLDIEKCLEEAREKNKDIVEYNFSPIQYVEHLEPIDMFQEGFINSRIPTLYASNVKRKEWAYENEWRLRIYKENMGIPLSILMPKTNDIKGNDERKFFYNHKNVASILLGKYFFNGENCENVDVTGTICTLKYHNKKYDFVRFINFLYKYFNDKLYLSGEILEPHNEFGRSIQRIELKKIKHNVFQIIPIGEVYSSIQPKTECK